jgi:hypothetical protein
MNTRQVYWVVLALVLGAWFANNPVKKFPSDSPSKAQVEITKVFKDTTSFGVSRDQWIVGGKCNIEYINGVSMKAAVHKLARSTPLRLVGWAMDIEKVRLPESVIVRFEEKDNTNYFALAKIGFDRTDVRDYFSVAETLVASGFETNINLIDLPDGEYALTLIIKFFDAAYVCDNGRRIVVH